MGAPKGNEFWKARSRSGRKKKFSSAEELWGECVEYFEWVAGNPLYESRIAQSSGEPKIIEIPKMRAMTIGGMCIFLDINIDTWLEWRKDNDFSGIIKKCDAIIRCQKFEGASANLLNANIIARDLGLADKAVVTTIEVSVDPDMSPEAAAKAYSELMSKT